MSAPKKPGTDENVAPQWHAEHAILQEFGSVIEDMPHYLSAKVRAESVKSLNVLLANTITLRDMYKKHHWQISGPTFYELHLLFDKFYEEQSEFADLIGERIQLLGGVTVAMGGDASKIATIPAPPIGKEEVPYRFRVCSKATKSS